MHQADISKLLGGPARLCNVGNSDMRVMLAIAEQGCVIQSIQNSVWAKYEEHAEWLLLLCIVSGGPKYDSCWLHECMMGTPVA